MERRKFSCEDVGSRVEDVFWAGLQVLIPDLDEAIWFVRRRGVLGV
jgi:hypothetical protein